MLKESLNLHMKEYLEEIIKEKPYKVIMSNPKNKALEYKKIVIEKIEEYFQISKYSNNKVYHENVKEIQSYIIKTVSEYKQCTLLTAKMEYNIKLSKKGKVFLNKKINEVTPVEYNTHNRQKNYIIKEGKNIPPLVDIGVLTSDGKIVKSMYNKYKQINRFLEIIDDYVSKLSQKEITLLDFGCGKSYLTFVLYYYFKEIKAIDIKIVGLDLKEDVVDNCNKIASKYGYCNLSFKVGDIIDYDSKGNIDIVVCLHACDIATDYALYNAVKWNAKMIFAVPCCQHELNWQIKSDQYSIITKYGIVKERISALLTDSIRANLLTSHSYKTQVLEFVDFEHSPKNIMIRAIKTNIPPHIKQSSYKEVENLCEEFNLDPTLKRLFEK